MTEKIIELWNKIESEHPLVHCITNIVTVNDCANILLAAGASPTMSHHIEEAADVTAGCRSLVLNMGAMECLEAMARSGKKAREQHKPVVIDPVGAAGAAFRRESTLSLMSLTDAPCIRGNYSEIRALLYEKQLGAGVDVQEYDLLSENAESAAFLLAKKLADSAAEHPQMIADGSRTDAKRMADPAAKHHYIAASGAVDYVTDGTNMYAIHNGSRMMAKVTGMGCMSSALMGAFLAVENSLISCAAACAVMGICGEIAEEKTRALGGGTGTFHLQFTDAVSLLDSEQIRKRLKMEEIDASLLST